MTNFSFTASNTVCAAHISELTLALFFLWLVFLPFTDMITAHIILLKPMQNNLLLFPIKLMLGAVRLITCTGLVCNFFYCTLLSLFMVVIYHFSMNPSFFNPRHIIIRLKLSTLTPLFSYSVLGSSHFF